MLELIKLIVDGLVLRDGARKGILTWKVMLFGFGFAIMLYGTAVPAVVLYQNHPQYKPLFVAAIAFDAIAFILFMIFGTRWYLRATARLKAEQQAQQPQI
jgi:hypothetical protein